MPAQFLTSDRPGLVIVSMSGGVDSSVAAASLLESIVDMARRLGKRTVAEGIETPEQALFLEECQCTYLQGYLFSKPLPEREFFAYARARNGSGLQNVA